MVIITGFFPDFTLWWKAIFFSSCIKSLYSSAVPGTLTSSSWNKCKELNIFDWLTYWLMIIELQNNQYTNCTLYKSNLFKWLHIPNLHKHTSCWCSEPNTTSKWDMVSVQFSTISSFFRDGWIKKNSFSTWFLQLYVK